MKNDAEKRYTFTGEHKLLAEINDALLKERELSLQKVNEWMDFTNESHPKAEDFPIESRKMLDHVISFVMQRGRVPINSREYDSVAERHIRDIRALENKPENPWDNHVYQIFIATVGSVLESHKPELTMQEDFEKLPGWREVTSIAPCGAKNEKTPTQDRSLTPIVK
ncbi:MAG: hypothetical protein ACOY3I_01015 [Verrucomicrobiota bacterium]